MKRVLFIVFFQFLVCLFLRAQSYYTGGLSTGVSYMSIGSEASFGKYAPYKVWGRTSQVYFGGGIGIYGEGGCHHDYLNQPFEGLDERAYFLPIFAETRVISSPKKFALFYGLRLSAENTFVSQYYFDEAEELRKERDTFYRLVPSLAPICGFRWNMFKHLTLNLRFGLEFRPITYGMAEYCTPTISWVWEFR